MCISLWKGELIKFLLIKKKLEEEWVIEVVLAMVEASGCECCGFLSRIQRGLEVCWAM
jgi:hypothetical protein